MNLPRFLSLWSGKDCTAPCVFFYSQGDQRRMMKLSLDANCWCKNISVKQCKPSELVGRNGSITRGNDKRPSFLAHSTIEKGHVAKQKWNRKIVKKFDPKMLEIWGYQKRRPSSGKIRLWIAIYWTPGYIKMIVLTEIVSQNPKFWNTYVETTALIKNRWELWREKILWKERG